MDTEKCKTLLCILENGSLSCAAEKLGYTPSGISRMIASMEQETGFPLLIRSRRGVVPTAECQKLLPMFRELSYLGEQYSQMSAQIRGVEIGEISIGTSYRTYYHWLTQMISTFVQSYPEIKIHILEGNSSELTLAMEKHKVDFCIISHREGDFLWIPLQENPLVAWLPPKHPYAEAEFFPLSTFETEPYIDTYPDQDTDNARIFRRNHIKPNIRFSTTDNYATYCMVEAGLGISLNNGLNAVGWNGKVIIKPLDPPQNVMIGIAVPSLDLLSPAAKRFVSLVKSRFDNL
jgi:DNA-binding transcriptional LysR family regulator